MESDDDYKYQDEIKTPTGKPSTLKDTIDEGFIHIFEEFEANIDNYSNIQEFNEFYVSVQSYITISVSKLSKKEMIIFIHESNLYYPIMNHFLFLYTKLSEFAETQDIPDIQNAKSNVLFILLQLKQHELFESSEEMIDSPIFKDSINNPFLLKYFLQYIIMADPLNDIYHMFYTIISRVSDMDYTNIYLKFEIFIEMYSKIHLSNDKQFDDMKKLLHQTLQNSDDFHSSILSVSLIDHLSYEEYEICLSYIIKGFSFGFYTKNSLDILLSVIDLNMAPRRLRKLLNCIYELIIANNEFSCLLQNLESTTYAKLYFKCKKETSKILHIILNDDPNFYYTKGMLTIANSIFADILNESFDDIESSLMILSFPSYDVSYPTYYINFMTPQFFNRLIDICDVPCSNVRFIILKCLELFMTIKAKYGVFQVLADFPFHECMNCIEGVIDEIYYQLDSEEEDYEFNSIVYLYEEITGSKEFTSNTTSNEVIYPGLSHSDTEIFDLSSSSYEEEDGNDI